MNDERLPERKNKVRNVLTDPYLVEIGDKFMYEGTVYVAGNTAELSEDYTKVLLKGRKPEGKNFKHLEINSFASVVIL